MYLEFKEVLTPSLVGRETQITLPMLVKIVSIIN